MDTKWQPAMMSAISEVLETMFFESVDFEPWDSGAHAWYGESAIGFSNGKQGLQITLRVAEPFARGVAANFLGLGEEDVSLEDVADVMRELANMVGGNFLGRLGGRDWQLGIPSFTRTQGSSEETPSELAISYMGERVGVVSLRPVS